MPTVTFEYRTEEERFAIERAVAFVTELRQLALIAPDGQVLNTCEAQALDHGRELLRGTLQQALQARIDTTEQKGAQHVPARAPDGTASSGLVRGK